MFDDQHAARSGPHVGHAVLELHHKVFGVLLLLGATHVTNMVGNKAAQTSGSCMHNERTADGHMQCPLAQRSFPLGISHMCNGMLHVDGTHSPRNHEPDPRIHGELGGWLGRGKSDAV